MSGSHSLHWRLTVAMLSVFVVGLFAAAFFSHMETRGEVAREQRTRLRNLACDLLGGIEISGLDAPVLTRREETKPSPLRVLYTLYDAERRAVASSPGLREPLPYFETTGADRCGQLQLLGPEQGFALAARAPGGHTLVVAQGSSDHQRARTRILLDEAFEVTLVFVPSAIVSCGLVWLVGMWSLRPLSWASQKAAAIGPDNPSGRVPTHGLPREIRPLVDAANGAFERLDRAYVAQRRFTADAAHELRTPLAVLNLRLQRARLDGAVDWPSVERDLAHLNRTVDQLMDLARREDPARDDDPARWSSVNLARVVREAAAAVLPLAEGQGRSLEVDAPDTVPVRGRSDDLHDAVRNLLDNALIHGQGTVRARVGQEPGDARRVLVEVSDQGPDIGGDLKEMLFDRFRKGTPTSPGAGLGLAIVRHIILAHGGSVAIRAGPGWTVQIFLPVLR